MSKITYRLKDKNGEFVSPEFGSYEAVIDSCEIGYGMVVVQIKEIELIYTLTITAEHRSITSTINLHVEESSDKSYLQTSGRTLSGMFQRANYLDNVKWTVVASAKE